MDFKNRKTPNRICKRLKTARYCSCLRLQPTRLIPGTRLQVDTARASYADITARQRLLLSTAGIISCVNIIHDINDLIQIVSVVVRKTDF